MSERANEAKVPVTVLTGFLGAGKTTLLNRILTENHGKRIAVIENEFGEVGVDEGLVIGADEEIFEMNNGCICCTVRGDLIRILGNLMKRRDRFDSILVETTGLADPAPVAQTFFVDDEIGSRLALDGVVAVVDAKHVWQHFETSDEVRQQIAFADVVLLNKIDLVPPAEIERLEARVRAMNGVARVHRTRDADVPMEAILDLGGFDLDRAIEIDPRFLEPELPFEWAGIYAFERGTYELRFESGEDPSMTVVVLPLGGPSETALAESIEIATHAFSGERRPVAPGGTIVAGGCRSVLDVAAKPASFALSIPRSGAYALFTEHGWEEFSGAVRRGDRALPPAASRVFAPGHEHDRSIGSVGISIPGDLELERLNKWLSRLLRERGQDIFRMKGILAIRGEEARYVFQGVHMLLDGRPEKPWGGAARENRLVFIGRGLDRADLEKGFRRCLA